MSNFENEVLTRLDRIEAKIGTASTAPPAEIQTVTGVVTGIDNRNGWNEVTLLANGGEELTYSTKRDSLVEGIIHGQQVTIRYKAVQRGRFVNRYIEEVIGF